MPIEVDLTLVPEFCPWRPMDEPDLTQNERRENIAWANATILASMSKEAPGEVRMLVPYACMVIDYERALRAAEGQP